MHTKTLAVYCSIPSFATIKPHNKTIPMVYDTILHYICMSYCIAACNTEYYAADSGSDCGCDSPIVASGPSASKSVQSTSAGKRVAKGARSQTNLKDGKLIIN